MPEGARKSQNGADAGGKAGSGPSDARGECGEHPPRAEDYDRCRIDRSSPSTGRVPG